MDICVKCAKEIESSLLNCPFCGFPRPDLAEERFCTEIINPTQPELTDHTVLESLTVFPDKTVLESDPDKTILDDANDEVSGLPLYFAWLVFLDKEGQPWQDVRLTREKTVLGKGVESDVRINDDYASKLHAIIHYQAEDNTFMLSDLGATNHTWLNGKSIIKEILKDGDRLRMGRQEMIFKQVRRPL